MQSREAEEMNFRLGWLFLVPALGRAVPFIPGRRSSSEPMVGYRGGSTTSPDPGVARVESWGQGDVLTICGSSGRGGGVLLVPG